MYRKLPPPGGTPRQVAEVVNNLVEGKSNNTGEFTLNTGFATTTTITNERIGVNSVILLMPASDNAETDVAPYGEFISTSQQLAPSIGSTAVVEFDTTHESNGVYLDGSNPSRIYVRNNGIYQVMFSLQLANDNNDAEHADIWFRIDGTDEVETAKRFGLPARKSTGDPSHTTGTTFHMLELTAGQYIEIAGATSSTDISLETFAASATPYTRPEIPSAAISVQAVAASSYDSIYISSQQQGQATVSHFANDTANKTYRYVIIG